MFRRAVYAGETTSAISDTTEIAPVIAILRWKAKLVRSIDSVSKLKEAHDLVIDRSLGQNGQRAARSIGKLLAGIATVASVPKSPEKIEWACPQTGVVFTRASVTWSILPTTSMAKGQSLPALNWVNYSATTLVFGRHHRNRVPKWTNCMKNRAPRR
ncbi:hypothetical protein F442_08063 [Phytophthora nicotianae P10297]|uniref:Uncharacterized protein n=1 Tax=Phytophthora nicotianae P10297 TaxID=1317064 RepID=W2ZDW5_PHYNI|nr:hypothetical protein F442_08063 [Phytophthora nicotianae P10297]